jgi:hypothetical protein
MKIYIAGPMYRKMDGSIRKPADTWSCIRKAIEIAMELYKRGHKPYIPHLNALIDIVMHTDMKGKDWVEGFDFPWLEACDALYFIAESKGANQELEYAKSLGKIIYYRLEDVPYV